MTSRLKSLNCSPPLFQIKKIKSECNQIRPNYRNPAEANLNVQQVQAKQHDFLGFWGISETAVLVPESALDKAMESNAQALQCRGWTLSASTLLLPPQAPLIPITRLQLNHTLFSSSTSHSPFLPSLPEDSIKAAAGTVST